MKTSEKLVNKKLYIMFLLDQSFIFAMEASGAMKVGHKIPCILCSIASIISLMIVLVPSVIETIKKLKWLKKATRNADEI